MPLAFFALASIVKLGWAVSLPSTDSSDIPVEATGGELQVYWNKSLLVNVGLQVVDVWDRLGETDAGFDRFVLRGDSTITAATHGRSLRGVTNATLYVQGGYTLSTPSVSINLRNFILRLRPSTVAAFDLVLQSGETPFYADKLMAEPGTATPDIAVRTMDLRISPTFASRLGKPEIAGWQVATLRVFSRITNVTSLTKVEACPSSTKWAGNSVPGHPGEKYLTDVFMRSFDVQMTGCRSCTGPGGQGLLKITPTTLLRNNVNAGSLVETVTGDPNGTSTALFSADVPWREMFSANCPPYGNDQHPYLTWNLYRIDPNGQLTQMASSGVKHGHIAENGDCVDNPGSNHILGRGCTDAYGTGDNDVPEQLGPRSEIIPATGQWGRCGSIYDPHCRGKKSDFQSYDDFSYRLLVRESAIDPSANAGATFYLETWYVVRDDIDPYNSMAHVPIEAKWFPTNGLWSVTSKGIPKVGPVIDAWVDPKHASANAMSTQIATPKGHIKVAVRVTTLEKNRYRYDYALMNIDFATVKTKGREPDLRIISSHGLSGFRVRIAPGTHVTGIASSGVTAEGTQAWQGRVTSDSVEWAGTSRTELTWGTVFRFSFEADRPQKTTLIDVLSPSHHSIKMLGPN